MKNTIEACRKIAAIGFMVWVGFPLPALWMADEAEELFPEVGALVSILFYASVLCCILACVSLEHLFRSKTLRSGMVALVFVALTVFPYALYKSMVHDQIFERKLSEDEVASIKRRCGRIIVHYGDHKTIVRCRRY